jgi:hypothetical protein
VASNKTSVRMAHAERTAARAPCKAKSIPTITANNEREAVSK